jgi:hypothetical protein
VSNHFPITPPPELMREWCAHSNKHETYDQFWNHIATQAAQWGADHMLEVCIAKMDKYKTGWTGLEQLRVARRPKPPTLKEQALKALEALPTPTGQVTADRLSTIRAALEALND